MATVDMRLETQGELVGRPGGGTVERASGRKSSGVAAHLSLDDVIESARARYGIAASIDITLGGDL